MARSEEKTRYTAYTQQDMYTQSIRTFLQATLVLIGEIIFHSVAAAAGAPENFQVVDGVAIYLGVIPAQIVLGHPKERPEATMHGGVPAKGHHVHVVVALFDNATGLRIEDAQVTGNVMQIGLASEQKDLEPMRIADTITYGNYFNMPENNIYHIDVQIRRPDVPDVVEAQFTYRYFGD
jgi:hypothetical protein